MFRSPAAGRLHALVADHVVQGRVIFPGAGYLELARAAASSAAALASVFFLQPLAVETPRLLIECAVRDGRFEVRSGVSDEALIDAAAHSLGAFTLVGSHQQMGQASVRASGCVHAIPIGTLYDGFHAAGLQYGPGYRTLLHAWRAAETAMARLRARSTYDGTLAHPGDLDDALCLSALLPHEVTQRMRLPFAVDDAFLHGAQGELWAVKPDLSNHPTLRLIVAMPLLAGDEKAERGGALGVVRHGSGRGSGAARGV